MTEIEKQALALVNEVQEDNDYVPDDSFRETGTFVNIAFCRLIERHEAFRRDVSECVVAAKAYYEVPLNDLSAFIIAKPDPLVEAYLEAFPGTPLPEASDECAKISAALAARGLEIVEKKS